MINHGIPPTKIDAFQNAMKSFFALPYDTKLRLKRNASNARGYFDDELTKRKRDWKEALDVGVPGSRDWNLNDIDDKNNCLDGFNIYPSEDECPNFREVVVEYFDECSKLSSRLATLMTLALNNGQNNEELFLERMKGAHTSYLRMNYYPPCGEKSDLDSAEGNSHNNGFSTKTASSGTLGISPHRDAGFLTILLQDYDCHSLQVARFEDDDLIEDDDRWVTVHPVPGSLTINTGDMAMICSNGRFRAPLHRVLTDPGKKRYSAPYFYNPSYDELCRPFASCCSETKEGGDKQGDNKSNELKSLKYHPCLWGYFRALRFAGDLCGKTILFHTFFVLSSFFTQPCALPNFSDLGVEIQTSHFKLGSESSHIEKQRRFMEVVDFEEPFNVEKYRYILE